MQQDLLKDESKPNPNKIVVTGKMLGKYLGLSDRQIRRLAQATNTREAVVLKADDNRYLFHQSVKGYITYLKEYQGIDDDNGINPKQARATFEFYRAEEQKIKVMTMKKELVALADATNFIAELFTEVKQSMRQIGSKTRDKLVGINGRIEIKKVIDDAINSQLYMLGDSAETMAMKILGDDTEIEQ